MGLQAAVHLGHMPWALTKEEEEEEESCNESNKILQMITSTYCYLGSLPLSANRNNVGVEQNFIPPLNNKRKVYSVNFKLR
jgi:hypothetical protein